MKTSVVKHVLILAPLVLAATAMQSYNKEKAPTLAERQAEAAKGKYVIAVGIDDYASPDITDLRFCEADARLFAETLISECAYPEGNVRILLGPQASHDGIYRAIAELADRTRNMDRDTVLFYFCGHAMCFTGENLLLPWDGSVAGDSLDTRNIPLSWVENQLSASGFSNQVLFLDICRGEFTEKDIGKATRKELNASISECRVKGMKILLASECGQMCHPNEELGHGLFTYALAKGLSGSACEDTGLVTLGGLEDYVSTKLKFYGMANPEYQQTPVSYGQAPADISLAAFRPHVPEPDWKQVRAHMDRGYELENSGCYEEALSEFQAAVDLAPRNAKARHMVGHVCFEMGYLEKAAASYREAIRLDPYIAPSHSELGLILADLRRYDEAIAECQEAVRLKPYAPYHNNLGYVYSKQGSIEDAIVEFKEAIRIHPDSGEAHHNLGYVYVGQGRYREAITHFEKAIRVNPKNAAPRAMLGRAYYELEELDKAREQLQKALELSKPSEWPHSMAVEYLEKLDQE